MGPLGHTVQNKKNIYKMIIMVKHGLSFSRGTCTCPPYFAFNITSCRWQRSYGPLRPSAFSLQKSFFTFKSLYNSTQVKNHRDMKNSTTTKYSSMKKGTTHKFLIILTVIFCPQTC